MQTLGIGVDIIENSRIKKSIINKNFINRVFSLEEITDSKKMLKIAIKNKPNYVCLVPEKRKEITTEGGLNIHKNKKKLSMIINKLNKKNIRTSLFINPNLADVK